MPLRQNLLYGLDVVKVMVTTLVKLPGYFNQVEGDSDASRSLLCIKEMVDWEWPGTAMSSPLKG